jgi:hypothetical protein
MVFCAPRTEGDLVMRSLLSPGSDRGSSSSTKSDSTRQPATRRVAYCWCGSSRRRADGPQAPSARRDGATADDRYFQVGYGVSVNGLTVGKGAFTGRVVENGYRLQGRNIRCWHCRTDVQLPATGEVEGRISTKAPQPRVFGSKASESRASQRVAMTFSRNEVANIAIQPQPRPESELGRVQLTRSHLKGVMDPMSAMIVPAGRRACIRRPATAPSLCSTGASALTSSSATRASARSRPAARTASAAM